MTTSGGAKCWGQNGYGGFGNGTTTSSTVPVDVTGLTSGVAQISSGGIATCAVTASGGAKCWGYNGSGGLGDGTTTNSSVPVDVAGLTSGVAQISSNGGTACAVTTSGGAKCWGSNGFGQLGDGTTTDRLTPGNVVGLASHTGDISVGANHTCSLLTSGTVKCWGADGFGEVGNGTLFTSGIIFTPVYVAGLSGGLFRVDMLIKRSTDSTFVGDNTYSSTAQGEGVTKKISAGGFATFNVEVQNDGAKSDPMTLGGCAVASGFVVTYRSGGVDITANMVAGTQSTGTLAPDGTYQLNVRIHARSAAVSGSKQVCRVRATSVDDVTKKDAVRATLAVR